MLTMAAATSTSTSPTPSDSTSVSDSAKSLLTDCKRRRKSKNPLIMTSAKALNYLNLIADTKTYQVKISFRRIDLLGHGSFGVVHSVKLVSVQLKSEQLQQQEEEILIEEYLKSHEYLALKSLLVKTRQNRELSILKELKKHRNISHLIFYYFSGRGTDLQLNMFFEKMDSTLADELESKGPLGERQSLKLCLHICEALSYLHSINICHRDIKPRNLLYDSAEEVLKLCDFGSAKIISPGEKCVSYMCSRYYRSPEMIMGSEKYSCKVDIWSSGCVLYEMVTAKPLFAGESSIDQLSEIVSVLGPPTSEDLIEMSCEDFSITNIFSCTRERDSLVDSICLKMGPFISNMTLNVQKVLTKIIIYNPNQRMSAEDLIIFIGQLLETR